jgi:hypothetical protein
MSWLVDCIVSSSIDWASHHHDCQCLSLRFLNAGGDCQRDISRAVREEVDKVMANPEINGMCLKSRWTEREMID